MRLRPWARAALLTTVTLTLIVACGSESRAPLSATKHNDADVSFAQDMVQHHAQALAMVNLTAERPVEPEFEALASRIREAQAPEIETMVDWLDEWGEEVPETSNDHEHADMGTMPHGSEDMPGMMSADEMADLEDAADADFQELWLELMIRHHEGAIEMSGTEVDEGRFKPAVDLAESIIDAQTEEIDEMKMLLSGS